MRQRAPHVRTSYRGPAGCRGFTLFELMLVLAVLVIVGALTYPAIRGPLSVQRLRKSGELVRTELARARLKAMRTGRVYVFRYRPSATQFNVESYVSATDDQQSINFYQPTGTGLQQAVMPSPRAIDLPEGVRFFGGETALDSRAALWSQGAGLAIASSGDPIPLLFYPDGTTSDAALVLINERQQCVQITIRGLTGNSRVSDVMTVEEVFQ